MQQQHRQHNKVCLLSSGSHANREGMPPTAVIFRYHHQAQVHTRLEGPSTTGNQRDITSCRRRPAHCSAQVPAAADEKTGWSTAGEGAWAVRAPHTCGSRLARHSSRGAACPASFTKMATLRSDLRKSSRRPSWPRRPSKMRSTASGLYAAALISLCAAVASVLGGPRPSHKGLQASRMRAASSSQSGEQRKQRSRAAW